METFFLNAQYIILDNERKVSILVLQKSRQMQLFNGIGTFIDIRQVIPGKLLYRYR